MHNGSCLCGAVRYEVVGDFNHVTHCHCSMCRKAHGAAFGTYGTLAQSALRFTEGKDAITEYRSSPGVVRTFCKQCGSTLQWYSEAHPEQTSITLGTLDSTLVYPDQKHIYTESKASWYTLNDDLPQSKRGS